MIKRIFKVLVLTGIIAGAVWFFDIDKIDFKERERIKPAKSDAPILRNEQLTQVFDRNFEGTVDEIIVLANQAREKEGLRALVRNEKLVQSAMAKAQDMKTKNYFEHISPEGLQPWFFAEQVNYKYKTFGENLAEGFFSSQEVHGAWMNSEGHRENIMSPNFEEIGVAILDFEQNGLKSYLIVQHFGAELNKVDLKPQVICRRKDQKNCEEAEEKKEEVKDAIEEQEKIIKDAEKKGASEEALKKLTDNLDALEDIKDEIKDYLEECEEFIKNCDKWE